MKLLNHTLLHLSIALLAIVSIWAIVFYYSMLGEIYDSIDKGLENYKILIIQNAKEDTSILNQDKFRESNYRIRKIPEKAALQVTDVYQDTLIYVQQENSNETVRLLTTAFKVQDGQYYELKIISSVVEEDELIEAFFYGLLLLYIVLLGSVLIVNNLVLKKVWKPFYHLLDQLKDFNLGSAPLFTPSNTNVDEFKALNASVLAMLKRNLDIFSSQKQFIENAAHELQTPLAISINKLELLAENESLSQEDQNMISNIIQTMSRLTRLNKSLLLLSKIENKQFLSEEVVNINDLLKKIMEEFSDLALFKNIKVAIKEIDQLNYKMNKDLAEILLTNLLKNAIVHNVEEGNGLVDILVSSTTLEVLNTGSSVPLDKVKMYDRFYKNSNQKNTTGLGLAIVKAISNHYGFDLNYSFNDKHSIVIKFK